MSLQTLAQNLLWIPLIFYYIAVFPQLIKNFYAKSTDGISTQSVLMFHVALLFMLPYAYFMRLPLAYRVIIPLQTSNSIMLVSQLFWYHPIGMRTWRVPLAIAWLASGCMMLVGCLYPTAIGNLAGWTGVCLMALYQLPQINLMWHRKSTHGLSKIWICINVIGALIEGVIGFILHVPLQTMLSIARRFSLNGMQLYQFYRYR